MKVKKYKLGDLYASNFDYNGMLQFALTIEPTDALPKLEGLFNSMEDVNYHTASGPLWTAITKLKKGETDISLDIAEFKELVNAEIKGNQE